MVFSNYRPISLLPLFSKLLEKVMYNTLSRFLNKCKMINKNNMLFTPKGFSRNMDHVYIYIYIWNPPRIIPEYVYFYEWCPRLWYTTGNKDINCLFHSSQLLEANNQLHILDLMYGILSHPKTKYPPVWQTTCSNEFSWMKMIELWFKFHWNIIPGVYLTIGQHCFR